MSDKNASTNTLRKSAVAAAAGLVVAGAMLAGCGEPKATPMNDEYAGNSGETEQSQEEQSQSSGGSSDSGSSDSSSGSSASTGAGSRDTGTKSDKKDTGNYADGTYSVNGQYGPIGEDTIDVHVTVKDQNVEKVEIVGHPFTTISKKHQTDFAGAINGVVDGKPLKGLKVDTVAGASWTTDAFNAALEVARQEASIQ
ncbi:FMN-binding protein [Bifidobacterium ramosum]|uniref:FMN-binding protein n=1 Tax=Bifidobacterium ramosum TaxID=1798158 RepID=A0A6L4X1W7_9BIFI|nr:FMN-binding protein [Bifidobacterium ramosum]KAB8288333.1 FMN-binding protein [Bifidobacterium ramosum]NEG71630.1 FMN-binding protein [Bifidobacterium ramosum]